MSSTIGISSNSQTWQAMMQQRKQDFSQLATALQGGDLSAAQKAFTDLQSLMPGKQGQQSGTTSSSGNSVQKDFVSLSQALQSGNLTDAQSTFAKLQSDLQTQGGGHRHKHGTDNDGQTSSGSTVQTDFSALGKALQSGNITDAQTAYAKLQSDLQTQKQGQQSTTTASGASAVQKDFESLSQALQSGNITDAQTGFTKLQNDLQSLAGSGHHHHHHGGGTNSGTGGSGSSTQNDFSSLGQALQSGNIQDAQTAFAKLQSDLQTQKANSPYGSSGSGINQSAQGNSSVNTIA